MSNAGWCAVPEIDVGATLVCGHPPGTGVASSSAPRSLHVASEGAASSPAPSYDLAFEKNRAAASSRPACVRHHPHSAKMSGRTDLPSKKRTRTSSRRATISPNARKRAPRMTPLLAWFCGAPCSISGRTGGRRAWRPSSPASGAPAVRPGRRRRRSLSTRPGDGRCCR